MVQGNGQGVTMVQGNGRGVTMEQGKKTERYEGLQGWLWIGSEDGAR